MSYSVSGGEDHRPRGVFWREPVSADTRADARAMVEVAPARRLGSATSSSRFSPIACNRSC